MREERELKFSVDGHEPLRERLQELGAQELAPPSREINWVFDRGDQLRKADNLLRLRTDGRGARLTLKGPTRWEGRLKVREEQEVEVGDIAVMQSILEHLGYSLVRRYEKVREEWELGGTVLALDQTPMGYFVEFEGDEAAAVARRFGFKPEHAERRTYLRLYEEYRQEHPDAPSEMIFP